MGEIGKFEKDGQIFEVRFFDTESFFDLRDLREIIQSPGVQRWMDNVRNMSHRHYHRWMKERGEEGRFLFAIAGADEMNKQTQRVHGFVYFYPAEETRGVLEISYAKRPGAPSGLIVPALMEACRIIEARGGMLPKIIAEIERGNDASIAVVEKAGFVKTRDFDRYGDAIWTLDWAKI